ncbi:hypothetical protein, partial [Nocardia sp. NRRL S-836]|uniref:hypothetical protein n=1 Tax=Nocardia sp. NRRL S-836 TaxID=1519492 RepID=UPI001E41AD68
MLITGSRLESWGTNCSGIPAAVVIWKFRPFYEVSATYTTKSLATMTNNPPTTLTSPPILAKLLAQTPIRN